MNRIVLMVPTLLFLVGCFGAQIKDLEKEEKSLISEIESLKTALLGAETEEYKIKVKEEIEKLKKKLEETRGEKQKAIESKKAVEEATGAGIEVIFWVLGVVFGVSSLGDIGKSVGSMVSGKKG